jgi:membrane fusion protein, multidrug efflux system
MRIASIIGTVVLFAALAGGAAFLVSFREAADEASRKAAAATPEHSEVVTIAEAKSREWRRTASLVGTVKALRSIVVRNEAPGVVASIDLKPGAIVEEKTVLVALDASVEEAELRANEARAALAATTLARLEKAGATKAASEMEVDRARAERDVALADVARLTAIIEKKTIRAPFRGRLGLTDVHLGQYLDVGATLTTLQSADDAVHVEFEAPQDVAAAMTPGLTVDVSLDRDDTRREATVEAVDALVHATTRAATVRVRLDKPSKEWLPGAAARVRVRIGAGRDALTVPATAVRRSPEGAHVFAIEKREDGAFVARRRKIETGPLVGGEVFVFDGLKEGERVAAAGSFKLYDGVVVRPTDGGAPSVAR